MQNKTARIAPGRFIKNATTNYFFKVRIHFTRSPI